MLRILVATDGSPHAIGAAKLTARFVRELREADVVLVNVGHIPNIALGSAGVGIVNLGALEEALQQAGRTALEKTAEALGGVGAVVRGMHRHGAPAGAVV